MKNDWKNVYFLGIGGIGMSALARWFKFRGLNVSGYDLTPSKLTESLQGEGIGVHFSDSPELVPASVEDTLVVFTPAVPESLGEMQYVRSRGYRIVKRAEALGEICRGHNLLAVAGTHGKTTTSTLVAHILTVSGEGCSAFLGGISKNYGTNLLLSSSDNVVAEADEFDRSFFHLHPAVAAITAMDADHLDIYGDLAHVQQAFRQFASQVSGTVVKKLGLPLDNTHTAARILTYHFNDERADFHSANLSLGADGHYTFDIVYPGGTISGIRSGVLGWVNVENAVAAAAVCLCNGTPAEAIREAIGSFRGAERRLDEHVNKPGLVYIDDYAHHPAELKSAISSLRGIFPGRKITGVFQPHLYTRTRDFAPEFAEALSGLDKLFLLPIYPAREAPIPGVTHELIMAGVSCPEKQCIEREQLLETLKNEPLDVLVTFGAGNIDRFVGPITEMLENR